MDKINDKDMVIIAETDKFHFIYLSIESNLSVQSLQNALDGSYNVYIQSGEIRYTLFNGSQIESQHVAKEITKLILSGVDFIYITQEGIDPNKTLLEVMEDFDVF